MLICAMLSTVLLLTGCQTMTLSVAERSTVCAALRKSEPIQYLSDDDLRLVVGQFSRRGKDGQKMALAIMQELGC